MHFFDRKNGGTAEFPVNGRRLSQFDGCRRFVGLAAIVVLGCGKSEPKAAGTVAQKPIVKLDPWVIESSDANIKTPFLLWNGKVGFRFKDKGSEVESFSISDYEPSGEEKIRSKRLKSGWPTEGSSAGFLDMKSGVISDLNHKDIAYLLPGASHLSLATDQFSHLGGEVAFSPERAKAAWAERWTTDIEIDGPVEDQQAIRSFLFYLRSEIDPNEGMSVSPFGLSNTQYFGHIFWDADVWVFPALALIDPAAAKAIIQYRRARLAVAKENAKGTGYKFPWESSVTGRETVPGPSRDEEHISGDVAWAQHQAEALGLVNQSQPIVEGVGKYYLQRADRKASPYELKGVMSPDESHIGDNDLYTNLLAQWCANGGKWNGPVKFKLPRDDKSLITYDGDRFRGYKQAAAVLSIYPLQYPEAEKQGREMMTRFEKQVIKNGPAMTDSIHSIIWSRLGEPEKAYAAWQNSWKPFIFPPFLQFSEKRNRPTTYFTTGAAGSLQAVLYGFLGFRLDSRQATGAIWSQKLPTGEWLSIKPNLPKAWKSVTFRGFTLLGRRYTLTATHDGASVVPYVPSVSKEAALKEK